MLQEKRVAVFASGEGTNAENLIRYFEHHPVIKIVCVITDNPEAGVIEKARKLRVKSVIFSKADFRSGEPLIQCLDQFKITWIVLAGFLSLVPEVIIRAFEKRIVNIHPALLPEFGGKGMYGMKVHESVCRSGKKKSGITIHYVNNRYDEGEIIFQQKINLEAGETPVSLSKKIRKIELESYPAVIESVID